KSFKIVDLAKAIKKNNKNIHFLGLVSNGGVHSHIEHLKGLITAAENSGVQNSFIHAFTDGRDVDPKSGKNFIQDLEKFIDNKNTEIASITGRYYAMDRDNRWERVKLAYDALVNASGEKSQNLTKSIQDSYDKDVTDEFIKPLIHTNSSGEALTKIKADDVVIFFNFRTDRGRELTNALSQGNFPEQHMQKLNLHFVTMTNYDDSFNGINVIFDKENLKDTLGEILSKAGKTQIRIAETEKYPHVTFFFSGGQEAPFKGESRILRNSPKVATYDLKPEMSAFELTESLVPELEKGDVDFVCLNFANGDMVGHTGSMPAAIKACEAVDICAKKVIETGLLSGYTTLLIADHGNCETMVNPDGSPNTAHTTNPVPFILIDNEIKNIKNGVLGDIAPTILKLIGVEQPKAMTQKPLV
ncbi:2,3-bisphosphoglycerate-independent phosphoglycerate mutase, partial [Aurantibacter sp.]|uniref:2,3-bisphosphoglycerate-independent phosphoglycerate mutase n=1 Tax=Aurantibacter sp. TaxID=2807103 RepID=UPI0035C86F25